MHTVDRCRNSRTANGACYWTPAVVAGEWVSVLQNVFSNIIYLYFAPAALLART